QFTYATVTTGAGSILLNGAGGENDQEGNHGIALYNSRLETTTGSITLSGKGGNGMYHGNNNGVLISDSTLATAGGAVNVT
ncbi:hypothetical protein ABTE75_20665, partial [Acinetobacter baumannii]